MKKPKQNSPIQKATSLQSKSGSYGKSVQASTSGPKVKPNASFLLRGGFSNSLQSKQNQTAVSGGDVAQSKGYSSQLAPSIQMAAEKSLGGEFSGVKVHTGNQVAEAFNARAVAMGKDIHLAQRESPTNLQLMGHELAHVVQQGEVQTCQSKNTSASGGAPGFHHEHEADRAADAIVQGKQFDISTSVTSSGISPQFFKMSGTDQTTYPKTKTFVENHMPNTANDSRITAALNEFGTNTGTTARDIPADVAWGAGPDVKAAAGLSGNGAFSPGSNSTELRISTDNIIDAYEAETDAARIPGHELLLESTIIHEYTHYLDDQDGVDYTAGHGEEGQAMEEQVYGRDIDTVAHALGVLTAQYGEGTWEVKVDEKNAAYEQQFKITGATSGDGTYTGTPGTTANVTADAGVTWSLTIEHRSSAEAPWEESKIHNVQEGTDIYLVRSEDWTDRDMNDLTIRVNKT